MTTHVNKQGNPELDFFCMTGMVMNYNLRSEAGRPKLSIKLQIFPDYMKPEH